MKIYLFTRSMLNIILAISITGCGGAEEEDSSQKEITKTPPTTEEISTTRDLVSEADFDFISSADLDITIPASPSTTVHYFINICTDFSKENDDVKINYDSCKLRTSLDDNEQQFTLALSNAELVLIAQIWPIEDGAKPINTYWDITESGSSWNIVL